MNRSVHVFANRAFLMIGKAFSPVRPGLVHFIALSVALAACVDLTPPWSGRQDAASADASAEQAGTGGDLEVGPVDSGAPDQAPPADGSDDPLGQDGDGASPDTVTDANTDTKNTDTKNTDTKNTDTKNTDTNTVPDTNTNTDTITGMPEDASTEQPGAADAIEAGQADSNATDQALPADGKDATLGQDGMDSSGARPDTNADTNNGTGIVADGIYRVIARHSGKALEVHGQYTADGSSVDQWTYSGGNHQRWTLTHLGGNVYKILGLQSGKALEVASTSTANSTDIDIRTYTGEANQKWTLSAVSVGYFRLTATSSSGSALDVTSSSMADGANVYQYAWMGGSNYNQQWVFQAP